MVEDISVAGLSDKLLSHKSLPWNKVFVFSRLAWDLLSSSTQTAQAEPYPTTQSVL